MIKDLGTQKTANDYTKHAKAAGIHPASLALDALTQALQVVPRYTRGEATAEELESALDNSIHNMIVLGIIFGVAK